MPDTELSLPDYMTCLGQDVVDALADLQDERVIACGVYPEDNSLVFVTNRLTVRSIAHNGRLVPHTALPASDGRSMRVSFVGFEGNSVIDTILAIKQSKVCSAGGGLYVGGRYVCNVEVD